MDGGFGDALNEQHHFELSGDWYGWNEWVEVVNSVFDGLEGPHESYALSRCY